MRPRSTGRDACATPSRALTCASGRVAILWVLTAVSAWAADDNQVIFPGGTTPSAPGPSAASGGTFNTVTLFLAVLLAAAGAWVYWRNRNQPGTTRGSNALKVEETKALGNRQYLVVASYEGKRFLLGVCPGRIDLLSPLDQREEPTS